MGLDSVEIVMEVEDHFGVTLRNEEAGSIRTVGDMVDLLEARMRRRETAGCLSLPWFLKLRQLTREASQRPELRIRPATRVSDALQANERKQLWLGLKEYLGAGLPELRRPTWISAAIVLIATASPVLLAISGITLQESLTIVSVLCALGAISLMSVTRRFKVIPPKGYQTFGDVTLRLVGLEAATNSHLTVDRELILSDLAAIITKIIGVKPEQVTLEARFVEDLGVG